MRDKGGEAYLVLEVFGEVALFFATCQAPRKSLELSWAKHSLAGIVCITNRPFHPEGCADRSSPDLRAHDRFQAKLKQRTRFRFKRGLCSPLAGRQRNQRIQQQFAPSHNIGYRLHRGAHPRRFPSTYSQKNLMWSSTRHLPAHAMLFYRFGVAERALVLSHRMYLLISFRKSIPPQNLHLIVHYYYLKY